MSAPTRVRQGHIHAPVGPRFRHVLESELIKLTSLRSTALLAAALLVLGLGVSVLFAVTLESGGVPSAHSVAFSLDAITLGTVLFGQIIAGVLGVLAISAEYSSGTIQPTLIAVPRRSPIIVAKALVLFPAVTVTAFIALLGSWAATYPIYAGYGIQTELTEPGFFFAIVGGAVYVGLCAVFGVGVGALLRSAAGGAIVVFCTTLLAPILTSVLPTSELVRTIRLYMLSHAGDSMVRIGDPTMGFADASSQYLSPAGGWITATVWALAALLAGLVAIRRRDV
ncbi:ABC transporter permease subunit [Pseudoclavibacter sp. RFBA6]|uniref:ABC transporter permease subunit n=1 Tax=Pseudoclavibacter sp. RFBA6 TaxID=2080573 RepID=UPI000CE83DF0|nr:ABC transporter permease subunit [Pseudoclavibacter sp. RFBA6]PPG42056.1 ABC transporter permease [Pseudoclavibacter sp. RFBA6]